MLDLAFNLTNDPLFYIVTFAVLINLSGISATVFLYKHLDSPWFENSNWHCQLVLSSLEREAKAPHFGQPAVWIAKFVRRKESPQDDNDDHFLLLDLGC